MQPDYLTLAMASARITELSGHSIASSTLADILGTALMHAHGSTWRLTMDHVRPVAMYWAEWGNKNNRPIFAHWATDHGFTVPGEFAPSVPMIVKQPKKEKTVVDDRGLDKRIREIAASVVREIAPEEARKVFAEIAAPTKAQITAAMKAPRGRENDPQLEKIATKASAFVHHEHATIDEVWNYFRKRFEEVNGVHVMTIGNQTFPQWLRSEGWVDVFAQEYKDFLDELHDILAGVVQGRLPL
jgi:hypothetical protein